MSSDKQTFTYKWSQELVTHDDKHFTLPQYYRKVKDKNKDRWIVVNEKDVPAETGLAKVESHE